MKYKFKKYANINAKLNKQITKIQAETLLISQDAIGRPFLIGCNLSFSTSQMSLITYIALAKKENEKKPINKPL